MHQEKKLNWFLSSYHISFIHHISNNYVKILKHYYTSNCIKKIKITALTLEKRNRFSNRKFAFRICFLKPFQA